MEVEELPEHLKCPVCFEVPEQEIYQCQNGHTICNICVESLSCCPQCREEYGSKKMRNRAAEDLLDLMKFDCSFKSKGCPKKVSRKEVTTHLEDCIFGGESVALCKSIGYNCDYVIKTRRLDQALEHLKDKHAVIATSDQDLQINFKKITDGDRKSKTLWNPVIITTDSIHVIVLTFSNINVISFFCLWIGNVDEHNFRVEYSILGRSKEVPALEWSMKPIAAIKSDNILYANPFRFPLDLFEGHYMHTDELVMKLSLTNLPFSRSTSNASWKSVTPHKALCIPLEKKVLSDSSVYLTMSKGKSIRRSMTRRDPIPLFKIDETKFPLRSPLPEDLEPVTRHNYAGAYCDVCDSNISVNKRYKCLQCSDYDLCSTCMSRSQHSHIFAVIQNYEQNEALKKKLGGFENECPYFELGRHNQPDDEVSHRSMMRRIDITVQRTAVCERCKKATEYLCLVCPDAQTFCSSCFQGIFDTHDKRHYFAVVKNNKAREATIKTLLMNKLI